MANSKNKSAKHLKMLRGLAGLSQYAVSKGTGIDRSRLSSIENGYVMPKSEEIEGVERFVAEAQHQRALKLNSVLSVGRKSIQPGILPGNSR